MPTLGAHLVVASDIRHSIILSSKMILNFVDCVILCVNSTDQHIVRDVVEVTTEFQPGTGGTDVIRSALSLHLKHSEHAPVRIAVSSLSLCCCSTCGKV